MIKELEMKNSNLQIRSIYDESFCKYGRILRSELYTDSFAYIESLDIPEEGNKYVAHDIDFFRSINNTKPFDDVFGYVNLQYGYVNGNNEHLDSLEYHKSSEINVCLTPLVLFLGRSEDIMENKYSSDRCEVFFVPEKTVIELYPGVLHFSPCKVSDAGFKCGVILPNGTNQKFVRSVENQSLEDRLLFKTNKWLLTHVDNDNRINQGVYPGITGINYKVEY